MQGCARREALGERVMKAGILSPYYQHGIIFYKKLEYLFYMLGRNSILSPEVGLYAEEGGGI